NDQSEIECFTLRHDSFPVEPRSNLGVAPISRLAGFDEVVERLGIGTEVAGVLRSIGIEPMVAVAAHRAEQASSLDRSHVRASKCLRRRFDTEAAQHSGQAPGRARMILYQGRDFRRLDPNA